MLFAPTSNSQQFKIGCILDRRPYSIQIAPHVQDPTMPQWLRPVSLLIFILSSTSCLLNAQSSEARIQTISMPQYSVTIEAGNPPQIMIAHDHEVVFQSPMVAGLGTTSSEETLIDIQFALKPVTGNGYILDVVAKSSIWTKRRFTWRFFPGPHRVSAVCQAVRASSAAATFFPNGISNRWDNGTTAGHSWNTTILRRSLFCSKSQSREPI